MANYNLSHTGKQIDAIHGGSVYIADANESDHGAAGSGASLKDLIDSIGTSDQATIRLSHSGSGNTTSYTVGTSIEITDNITLDPEHGAVFVDNSGNADLTISGSLRADPAQQIFDWGNGTGNVVLGLKVPTVYMDWWGTVLYTNTSAAGVANVAAFEYARDSKVARGGLDDTTINIIKAPSGDWRISSTLLMKPGQRLIGDPSRRLYESRLVPTTGFPESGENVMVGDFTYEPTDFDSWTVENLEIDGSGIADYLVRGAAWNEEGGVRSCKLNNPVKGFIRVEIYSNGVGHNKAQNWSIIDNELSVGSAVTIDDGFVGIFANSISRGVIQRNTINNNATNQYSEYGDIVAWQAATAYSIGDRVWSSTSYIRCIFEATTNGTSGGAAPTWDEKIDEETTDNTVTWKAVSIADDICNTIVDDGNNYAGLPTKGSVGIYVAGFQAGIAVKDNHLEELNIGYLARGHAPITIQNCNIVDQNTPAPSVGFVSDFPIDGSGNGSLTITSSNIFGFGTVFENLNNGTRLYSKKTSSPAASNEISHYSYKNMFKYGTKGVETYDNPYGEGKKQISISIGSTEFRQGLVSEAATTIYKTGGLIYVCSANGRWSLAKVANQKYWHIMSGSAEGWYKFDSSGTSSGADDPVVGAVNGDLWIALTDADLADGAHDDADVQVCIEVAHAYVNANYPVSMYGMASIRFAGIAVGYWAANFCTTNVRITSTDRATDNFTSVLSPKTTTINTEITMAYVDGLNRVFVELVPDDETTRQEDGDYLTADINLVSGLAALIPVQPNWGGDPIGYD